MLPFFCRWASPSGTGRAPGSANTRLAVPGCISVATRADWARACSRALCCISVVVQPCIALAAMVLPFARYAVPPLLVSTTLTLSLYLALNMLSASFDLHSSVAGSPQPPLFRPGSGAWLQDPRTRRLSDVQTPVPLTDAARGKSAVSSKSAVPASYQVKITCHDQLCRLGREAWLGPRNRRLSA